MRKFSLISESIDHTQYRLEVHYCKLENDNETYKTWTFNEDPEDKNYGWHKSTTPGYLDTSDTAKQWYIDSNNEDLIFIDKELKACQDWYNSIKNDILLAKKHGS